MKMTILMMTAFFLSCQSQERSQKSENPSMISKSDAQWKKELTKEQYYVLREKGTEAPFSGEYNDHFKNGIYVCAACGNKLFESGSKFKSDCGWPSFDKAIKGSVDYHEDISYGMRRTEVTCSKCGGHLGHVFADGPRETTGDRYCTNSVSVKFIPAEK